MNKEFIPYQQALELKELGFNEPCFGWYQASRLKKEYNPLKDSGNQSYMRKEDSSAPTFSQTFRWFREKYNLHPSIYPIKQHWECDVRHTNKNVNSSLFNFDKEFTYEEAELACLVKLIEIVKTK